MKRNEVRALEDLNWEEGLDEFVVPQAYSGSKPKEE